MVPLALMILMLSSLCVFFELRYISIYKQKVGVTSYCANKFFFLHLLNTG